MGVLLKLLISSFLTDLCQSGMGVISNTDNHFCASSTGNLFYLDRIFYNRIKCWSSSPWCAGSTLGSAKGIGFCAWASSITLWQKQKEIQNLYQQIYLLTIYKLFYLFLHLFTYPFLDIILREIGKKAIFQSISF